MKIDLGRKSELQEVKQTDSKSPPIYYPSFYVDNPPNKFPDLDAGDTVKAVVDLKVRSVSMSQSDGSKSKESYSFDILSIEFKDSKKAKSDDEIEEGLKDEMRKS